MKRKHTLLCLILCLAMALSACGPAQNETTAEPTVETTVPTPKEEVYTAAAKGFGGDVTVTITVLDGIVKGIDFVGPSETPAIGGDALQKFNTACGSYVGQALSTGFSIDTVSGATATSNAAAAALANALFQASGQNAVQAVLADGTYTASVWGFSLDTTLPVTVTIAGGKMTEIIPDVANSGETDQIIKTAIDNMIPRILAEQSVAVDAVSGATSSSNAIKSAVVACLEQALIAGGVPENQVDIAMKTYYKDPSYDKTGATPVEITTGVLVVGGGGTGCLAALEAANLGADTLVIETSAKYGGTSALTCGPMVVNSPAQVAATGGVDLVDEDLLYSTWLEDARLAEGSVGAQIIDDFMKLSGYNIDWMEAQGFETFTTAITFKFPQFAVWTMYPGWNAGKVHGAGLPHSYFDNIMARYTSLGGKTMFETTGTDLLVGDDGSIQGVVAVGYDNQVYHIYADAVILATGGYAGNEEMLKQYTLSNDIGVFQAYGLTVNKGAGILMAQSVGARLPENMGMTMAHFSAPSKRIHMFDSVYNQVPTAFIVNQYVLDVNTNGERYISETSADPDSGDETPRYYTIVGSKQLDSIRENGFVGTTNGMYMNPGSIPPGTPLPEIDKVIDAGVELGFIFKADTLEGLAATIKAGVGAPMEKLAETVANYNAMCAAGVDTQFGKPAEYMIPVEGEYFVAIEATPIMYSTCGGIDVDTEMRVVKEDGTSIENLFAAGTDSIGVMLYDEYIDYGGVAQSWAFCSGRMAGTQAAMYSLNATDISADVKAAVKADPQMAAYADLLTQDVTVEKVSENTYDVSGEAAYVPGVGALLGKDTDDGVNYVALLLDAPAGAAAGTVTKATALVGEGEKVLADPVTVANGKALYILQVNHDTNRQMGLKLTVDYAGQAVEYTIYTDLLVMGEEVGHGVDVTAEAVAAAAADSKLKKVSCINVGLNVSFMGEGENHMVYALTGVLPSLPKMTEVLKADGTTGEHYAVVLLKAPAGYEKGKLTVGSTSLAAAYAKAVTLEDGTKAILYVQKFDAGVTLPVGSVKIEAQCSASGMEDKTMTYSIMFTELEYGAQLMDMGAALNAQDLNTAKVSITATAENTWKVSGLKEAGEVTVLLAAPNMGGRYQSLVINGAPVEITSNLMPFVIAMTPGQSVTVEAVWTTPASFWSAATDYPVSYTFVCE